MDVTGLTSAQIISEARASLKAVRVSRPITPASSHPRTLWGDTGGDSVSRPPSVHRLSRVPFIPSHKRPSSGVRLAPLSQTPTPHPPSFHSRAKSARLIRKSRSMEQIHIPLELEESLLMLELFSGAASTGWREDRLKNALVLVRSYLVDHKDENTALLMEQLSDRLLTPVFKIIQTLHSSSSEDVSLLLLACALALVVYGVMRTPSHTHLTNLTTICQVIFSLARDEKHDVHFSETNCNEGMLLLLSHSGKDIMHEYLVYLLGTFKLLTSSHPSSLAEKYLSIVIPLSTSLVRVQDLEQRPLTAPCLLQVAWSLRNLCDSQIALIFLTSSECVLLVTSMLLLGDETSLYAAKVCSKLASNVYFQKSLLLPPAALNNLLSALPLNSHSHPITARLSYTLSQLVMDDINVSTSILSLPHGTTSVLETVSSLPRLSSARSAPASHVYSLVGNLALHPEVGRVLASAPSLSLSLISAFELVSDDMSTHPEFMTVLLTALNNLSYYQLGDESSLQLTLSLIHLLLHPHLPLDTIQLAVSCLGNLTRVDVCRTVVRESKTDMFLLALLDSDYIDVLFSTTGVLINLTSKSEDISSLLDKGLIDKLLSILVLVGKSDISVISHTCQILWNVAPELLDYSRHTMARGQCKEIRYLLSRIVSPATRSLGGEIKELENIVNKLLAKLTRSCS